MQSAMKRDAQLLHPEYTTPAELAGHLGMSVRTVKEKVAEIGAYAKLGRRRVMFPHHVHEFMEAIQCRSHSTDEAKTGTTGGPWPEGDYAALRARLTGPSRNGSKRKPKPKRGNVVSMGRGQG